MTIADTRRHFGIFVATALAITVALLSLYNAVHWYGRPFPGLLVDPDLVVSNVSLPGWENDRQRLGFPDRIVAIDGIVLDTLSSRDAAKKWDQALALAMAQGRSHVTCRIQARAGEREVSLRLAPLDRLAWWLYGGVQILVGGIYIAAALIAVRASPRGRLARTFAKHGFCFGIFLCTMFDFHTSRKLVPFFLAAFAMLPGTAFILPLRLPRDVQLLSKKQWIESAVDLFGLLLAVTAIVVYETGSSTVYLRHICTVLFAASLCFLTVATVKRFFSSKGQDQEIMRALFWPMVPALGIGGVALTVGALHLPGSSVMLCFAPFLALVPLSSTLAFVRYDIWNSHALLSRPLVHVIVTGAVAAGSTALGAAVGGWFDASLNHILLASAISSSVTGLLVLGAHELGDRRLFPTRARYKPTVAQLSEDLISIDAEGDVAAAVEKTVRKWLPCRHFDFARLDVCMPESGYAGVTDKSEASAPSTKDGEPLQRNLCVPVTFRGLTLAQIRVGAKFGGALFTSEDIDLLRTIANQAALALAHAKRYAELEHWRKEQAAAWRGERAAMLETIAAEIAHEIRYPINYFRSVLQRGAHCGKIDAEDVEIGLDEVARLERLVSGLRRVAMPRMGTQPVRLRDIVSKAVIVLRDRLGKHEPILSVSETAFIRCNPDQVLQAVTNLLSNAIDATDNAAEIGVSWTHDGAAGRLEVWDRGTGFAGDASQMYAPWFTTKTRGTGLGLAITYRIVRSHGWNIDVERNDECTVFAIAVSERDIVSELTTTHTEGTT